MIGIVEVSSGIRNLPSSVTLHCEKVKVTRLLSSMLRRLSKPHPGRAYVISEVMWNREVRFSSRWVRLTSNGTNPGLFAFLYYRYHNMSQSDQFGPYQTSWSGFELKRVRFASNEINMGLYKISFQYILDR